MMTRMVKRVGSTLSSLKRIAIIGGGPTALASGRFLLAENAFDTIDIFEQRSNVGGIWNLSEPVNSRRLPVPQIDPRYGTSEKDEQNSLEFESPLYDYLETNIPKSLMAYSDAPFDERLPLFPGHADVLDYLERYSEPIKHLIHFDTQVTSLSPSDSLTSLGPKWKVTTLNLKTGLSKQSQYDAVIVANGHYTVPHVPAVLGLRAWHQRYPDTVIHSKAYRRPEDFKEKKVLVIGNSASGLDIAGQLASSATHPVCLASRSASQLAPKGGGPAWRKDIAEIEEFLGPEYDRAVRTKSGEIIDGLDVVIFATGYFYAYPFLSNTAQSSTPTSNANSPPNSTTTSDSDEAVQDDFHNANKFASFPDGLNNLTTSGLRTHDVYKHFLHNRYPNLAFPVLNLKIIPFPLAENQAAVLARLWSGRLAVPSKEDMQAWEQHEEARLLAAHRLRPAPDTADGESVASGNPDTTGVSSRYEGGFHTLVYPEDATQINTLYDWSALARPTEGLENNGIGKLGTRWMEYQVWLRGQFPDIKAAYAKHGENRTKIASLDMLGDEWRDGFQKWQDKTSPEDQEALFHKAAVPGW